ncbi:MAG: tRNA lysidine(34) synthetase TilS [Solirubrobacterales bacterium]
MIDLPGLDDFSEIWPPEERLLLMLSGGGDSVGLLGLLVTQRGPEKLVALHVNYGLRGPESDADETFCRELCDRLGVELHVERVELDPQASGNLHDRARKVRYEAAESLGDRLGCRSIVVAHTADDQAETVLYRMFASPGSRALSGIPERRGRIVRPLLGVRRADLRRWCEQNGFEWREDASNDDPRFARARARDLLAGAAELHPAAIDNFLRTIRELEREREALDGIVGQLLATATDNNARLVIAELATMPAALARLVLRAYVESLTGTRVPAAANALDVVLSHAVEARGARIVQIDGAELTVEHGLVSLAGETAPPPPVATLAIPGELEFGDWLIAASAAAAHEPSTAAEQASLDAPTVAAGLSVRARNPGDRIRPAGLGGSKSLQDLFVDQKVPRALRDSYPIVCSGERIAWIPGLAIAEDVAPAADTAPAAILTATRT